MKFPTHTVTKTPPIPQRQLYLYISKIWSELCESALSKYTVQQGDCVSKIACAHGFSHWRSVYNHAKNAEFRTYRPNPDVLLPGDELHVPDKELHFECVSLDARHRFELQEEEMRLRLRIEDKEGTVMPDLPYSLKVEDRSELEGVTGKNGLIDHVIRADDDSAVLTLLMPVRTDAPQSRRDEVLVELALGALDPVETVTGQQARLNNLGFESGPVDGIKGHLTTGAVKRFQHAAGLADDGIVGAQTRPALERAHGS